MPNNNFHSSSFRDPSGYVFVEENEIKRQINKVYFKQYFALRDTGFFDKLIRNNLLIPHEELSVSDEKILIKPTQIPFITYPYEWSFNQYKEAALLTLKIQKLCLENGFSLKDASAFNITFYEGKPIFIDTLSFDFYSEGSPWRAYKQFISHFLGPLVLSKHAGSSSLSLMNRFIEGIPIKMLVKMLPFKSKLNPFLYANIHMLAKYEDRYNQDYQNEKNLSKLSKQGQINIITSLFNFIKKLSLKETSEWENYYDKVNYTSDALEEKQAIINNWLSKIKPETLIDVGGNNGKFVRGINRALKLALVCDVDNNAVDSNYNSVKKNNERHILPFVLDVLNPTPAIGFNNLERLSFLDRITQFKPDATLALALIHHMALSGNVTFDMAAKFLASFSNYLIIEFPKREDTWVLRLLDAKREFKSYFDFYNQEQFEMAFLKQFELNEKLDLKDSKRVMYLLQNKSRN